jgi:hypothetical protein
MLSKGDRRLPVPSILDPVEEQDATVCAILIFIIGLVEVFLIEVVFWREALVLFTNPRYVCLVPAFDIRIDVRRICTSRSPPPRPPYRSSSRGRPHRLSSEELSDG